MSGTGGGGTIHETYLFTAELQDKVSGPAGQSADAMDQVGQAAVAMQSDVAAAQDAIGKSFDRLNATVGTASVRAFNSLQRAIDPLGAQLRTAENQLDRLNRQFDQQRITLTQYTALLPVATQKVQDLTQRHDAFTASVQKAAAATSELAQAQAKAAQYQQAINDSLGVRQQNEDQYKARAADVAAYGNELDRLRAKFNPLFAVSKQYESQLNELNDALRVGAISEREHGVALDRLNTNFGNLVPNLRNTRDTTNQVNFGLRTMGSQFIDVAQQIATGQRPLQVFIQQGGQIAQIAANSNIGLRDMALGFGRLAASVATSPVTAIVAIGAALGGLTIYAESFARQQAGLRLALSGSRDDFAQMAKVIEESSRTVGASLTSSAADIAKAQQIIVQQGHFEGTAQDLSQVTKQAEALGKVMGTDLPTAMKLFATAATDPISAIKQIADSPELLRQVSTTTLALAKSQAELGDKAGATATLMKDLNKAYEEQQRQLTPLQRELKQTDEAFNGIVNSIRDAGRAVGDFLREQVVDTVKGVKEFIDLIKQIPALIPSSGAGAGPALSTREPNTIVGTPLVAGPYASQLNQATSSLGSFGQSLFQALIFAESSGNQFTSQGRPLLPGGGGLPLGTLPGYRQPVGIGQITPETASGFGYSAQDLTTVQGNIGASSAYFIHVYQKYKGDPTLVIAAFNMGEPALDALLRRPPSEQQFPIETQREIGKVLGTLYGAGVTAPGGGAGGAAAGAGGVDLGRGQFGPADNEGARRALTGDFGAGVAKQIADVRSQLKDATDAFNIFQQTLGGNDQVTKEYAGRVANLREQLANLLDPTREGIRASLQSADVTRLLGEADQKLLEKRQEIARYNEAHRNATISDSQATAALAAVQKDLDAQFDRSQAVIQRDIDAKQKQLAVYQQGPRAVADAVTAQQAYIETLKTTSETDARFADRLAETTAKLKERRDLDNEFAISDMSRQIKDQTQVLNEEIATLGEDNDTRTVTIDLLRTEQQLRADAHGFSEQQIQGILAEKKAVDELNQTLQGQQRDLDYLAGQFSSAFDTIGNSITEAFVQGQGNAIKFGDVMKGVASTIIQSFLRLSVINPVLNSLFGQNNPTIFSVANTIGAQGGFLGQGIFGTSAAQAAYANTPAGLLAQGGGLTPGGGGLSSPLAATGILGGASIGQLAFGTLGGFAIGSLTGGLTQSALGRTGPGPQIGSGVGALAGTAIGSLLGGPILGGILGGAAGGIFGGAIGPRPQSPYAATFVGIGPDGQLVVNPGLSGNQITASNLADIQNQAAQFNQAQQQLGVRIVGTNQAPRAGAAGGLGFFGTATNLAGIQGQNITDAFSNIRFGAGAGIPSQTVDVLNRALQTSFTSFDQLGQVVNKVRTFVEQTVPALLKLGTSSGSYGDAVENINKEFTDAIATAQQLGVAEGDLTAARDAALQKAAEQAQEAFTTLPAQYAARRAAAQAAISGSPTDALNAQLQAFDVQANAERKQLNDQFVSVFGDSVKSSEQYVDQMADLETTLGQERLAIQTQNNNQLLEQQKQADAAQLAAQKAAATQAAAQVISSIADYTRGLQTGQSSPLSLTSQLDVANRQFSAVAGAALAGDPNSLAKLTSYSDTLLAAGRQVFGSGAGYADLFNRVTDVLQRVSAISPDTLTASFFAVQLQTQTATLVASLASLQNEVAALRAQVANGGLMPARLAA